MLDGGDVSREEILNFYMCHRWGENRNDHKDYSSFCMKGIVKSERLINIDLFVEDTLNTLEMSTTRRIVNT